MAFTADVRLKAPLVAAARGHGHTREGNIRDARYYMSRAIECCEAASLSHYSGLTADLLDLANAFLDAAEEIEPGARADTVRQLSQRGMNLTRITDS